MQVFFFLSRDFNVCIKLSGNVYCLEIRHGICLRLNFGLGIFWELVFALFNHRCHLKSSTNNNYSRKRTSFLVPVFD